MSDIEQIVLKSIKGTRPQSCPSLPGSWAIEDLFSYLTFSVEFATDAIFWIDSSAKILFVNESACHTLDYSRAELTGKRIWDVAHSFTEGYWSDFWKALTEKKNVLFETQFAKKGDNRVSVSIKAHYLKHGDDELMFAFVSPASGG